MKQKFVLYKNSFTDFCKRSWRINKPMCVLVALVVVIAVFFLTANLVNHTQKAANQLMLTAENIRLAYQAKPNYWGLDNQSALKNNVFRHFRVVKNAPYNALGGKVLVGYGPLGESVMPGISGFDITYTDMTYAQCVALLSYPFSQAQNLGLLQILLYDEANSQVAEFAWGGENSLPVSEANAKNYCEKHNNILWHFE